MSKRESLYFVACIGLIFIVGLMQSWNVALALVNFGLVSAILALGVNIQWGYGGLFNAGIMGFVAVGGLAVVVTSAPPVITAWEAGAARIFLALAVAITTIAGAVLLWRYLNKGWLRTVAIVFWLLSGTFLFRWLFDPAVGAIETIDAARTGFLGGLGMPVLFAWPLGGLLAAVLALAIGKVALGLRSDYLAIATLAIAEVIVAVLKNEEWLTRGVKNISGLPRPVPYEINLQQAEWFQKIALITGLDLAEASSIAVKLCYTALLLVVLFVVFVLCERSLNAPWGRMMRSIRDNERAAAAMGKDVNGRQLQIFILGSAVCGIAGAILTTLDGQFTPASYQPLRFTFLIWVMVIVGGSGNNWGAVLGGLLIWFFWIQAEPMGYMAIEFLTSQMDFESPLRAHLVESAAHTRFLMMGLFLLLVMRFRPTGLIPER
ncbi:MAG: branched-chain amino acid ABC transporter permease [Rhodobacteraceae bacterium]|nr:branched-chain amino acid ABC transporter permease [Paracoccaceae bacterium]MCY4195828.1 branched-chain amino acid ABC transporter permease [Paracoccaceae bacterium]